MISKHDYTNYKQQRLNCIKKNIQLLIFIAICISTCLQLSYLFVLKKHGFEYLFEGLEIGIYLFMVLFVISFVALMKLHQKQLKVTLISIFSIMFISIILCPILSNKTVTIGPWFKHMLITETNVYDQTIIYHNQIFCFVKPHDRLPYAIDGEIKTQWVEEDICTVTYRANQKVHQYVATYGDRGTGISYYYVINALSGEWHVENDLSATQMTVLNGKVTLTVNGLTEEYSTRDCVQYGTIALVLCRNGIPQWTISLGTDCSLNENDFISQGHITLTNVGMGETKSVQMRSQIKQQTTETLSNTERNDYSDASTIVKMKKMIQNSEALNTYQSTSILCKTADTNQNIFLITRDLLKEKLSLSDDETWVTKVQINKIVMVAGTSDDCYMSVQTTEIKSKPYEKDKLTNNINYSVRIMKGKGIYLGGWFYANVKGDVGLDVSSVSQSLNTHELQEYCFKV